MLRKATNASYEIVKEWKRGPNPKAAGKSGIQLLLSLTPSTIDQEIEVGRFTAAGIHWPPVSKTQYDLDVRASQVEAVLVGFKQDTGRQYWLFQGTIYWDDESLQPVEVTALLTQRLQKRQAKIATAVASLEHGKGDTANSRKSIPDSVKIAVWQRDGGKCTKCGSPQKLEYDHIIPLAIGGANTLRNLQLLCETCNRTKGSSLT